jgi:hypothetical protein
LLGFLGGVRSDVTSFAFERHVGWCVCGYVIEMVDQLDEFTERASRL